MPRSRSRWNSAGRPVGNFSENPAISGNGRYVAFQSNGISSTANGSAVFVHDLQTGSTVEASVDSAGDTAARGSASDPSVNSDGRYIAFDASAQNLVPNDTNQAEDVFVHDTLTGQTTRVSVDSAGSQANDSSDLFSLTGGKVGLSTTGPEISADGRYVTFNSTATNLVADDTNTCTLANVYDFPAAGQCPDVLVHDLQTGATTRASVNSSGGQADGPSSDAAINADGSTLAYVSAATNLVPDDTNPCGAYASPGQCPDIFLHTP